MVPHNPLPEKEQVEEEAMKARGWNQLSWGFQFQPIPCHPYPVLKSQDRAWQVSVLDLV